MSSFFKVACPSCKKSLKVPESLSGKSRACPYCRATVRIPETTQADQVTAFPSIKVASDTARTNKSTISKRAACEPTATVAVAATERPTKQRRRSRNWFSSGSGDSATSDVSLFLSGLIGLVVALIWYGAMYPLRSTSFGQLFWERGPVPFPTTFVMCWAMAILCLKWMNLKKQREAMLLDVLPTEISAELTVESLDRFLVNINELPGSTGDSFLINRVVRGIEHFRVRKSTAETVTMMESQSAIDANNVAGSYTILKVFIWSLPILGFIGTVMGVSTAVASLASSLGDGASMDAMKDSLKQVFSGLGTAFDTTLLALIMSMLVKIPTSALQKSEDDLITSVDEYCNENLLRRLTDGREGSGQRDVTAGQNDTRVFREAVEQALGTQHAEMERWLAKLDAIGTGLTSKVAEGWDQVNSRIEQQQQRHAAQLNKQQLDQQARLQAQLDQMANAADKIQTTLSTLAGQTETMQSHVNSTYQQTHTTISEHLSGVQVGLASLSGVLEKLGDQQVVVQQVVADPTPHRRGWFGGRKRNQGRTD